ncbi:MAG: hypothetical protein HYZ53_15120 [Planctomycetes bacterium]|nr:hypothetical protein [Planctomycetota bacterium]
MSYKEDPFEILVKRKGRKKVGEKVRGISPPIGVDILEEYPSGGVGGGQIYLSCGDSANTDLPSKSVDLVVTDPPFFDIVHYSELADFFHVWQQLYFPQAARGLLHSTRRKEEVQDTGADAFAAKLGGVFRECARVLRDEGLLVFSYHHSREEGWGAVAEAVLGAGFSFVQSHPVKAEMSVAAPKSQAKEPIDLDILLVCRKREADRRTIRSPEVAFADAQRVATQQVYRFNQTGKRLSQNDVRIVLLAQVLVELAPARSGIELRAAFDRLLQESRDRVHAICAGQEIAGRTSVLSTPRGRGTQLQIFGP